MFFYYHSVRTAATNEYKSGAIPKKEPLPTYLVSTIKYYFVKFHVKNMILKMLDLHSL